MSYNDNNSTYIPKKVVAGCKNEAQLESFMKEAFDVPANRSVKPLSLPVNSGSSNS